MAKYPEYRASRKSFGLDRDLALDKAPDDRNITSCIDADGIDETAVCNREHEHALVVDRSPHQGAEVALEGDDGCDLSPGDAEGIRAALMKVDPVLDIFPAREQSIDLVVAALDDRNGSLVRIRERCSTAGVELREFAPL